MPNLNDSPMTLDDFQSAVDRWGATLSDWPAELVPAAEQLLSGERGDADADATRAARAALQAASALDNLFSGIDPHVTTPGLAERIAANAEPNEVWLRLTNWFQAALWRGAFAMMLPVMLGFIVGVTVPGEVEDDGLQDELSWLALSPDYYTDNTDNTDSTNEGFEFQDGPYGDQR